MKTIWTVIGLIVLISIIVIFYKMATKQKTSVSMMPSTPLKSNDTTEKVVTEKQTVIVPVVVKNAYDCGQSYKDNVLALFDSFKQKKVIYQNAISTNDPNVLKYHKEMNDVYNQYYNEASKCNYFIQ